MVGKRTRPALGGGSVEINIAPLIDMVFILLIFFLVTTSFIKETGVQVEKPSAASAESLTRNCIFIGIDAEGDIYLDRTEVGIMSLRARVKEKLRRKERPVVLITDKNTRSQAILDVIDECKAAGASRISLAAQKE